MKKKLKSFDPIELASYMRHEPTREHTKIFINESICPYYRGIWNKCKELRVNQKIHQLYDWLFDLCEIGGNWSLQNNYWHNWFERPFSRYRYGKFVNLSWNSLLIISSWHSQLLSRLSCSHSLYWNYLNMLIRRFLAILWTFELLLQFDQLFSSDLQSGDNLCTNLK